MAKNTKSNEEKTKKKTNTSSTNTTNTKKKTTTEKTKTTTKKTTTPKKTTTSNKAKTTKPKTNNSSTSKKTNNSVEPRGSELKEEVSKETIVEETPKITTEVGKTVATECTPKSLLGTTLPEGKEIEARRARKRSYSRDALLFAIIIPILDLLAMLFVDAYKPMLLFNSMLMNYIITLILDFILIYIVTYLIDFVMGEDAVKKKHK